MSGIELAVAKYIKQSDLERILDVSQRTLETWRRRGIGPPFIRVGAKLVRYRLEDVERWLAARASQEQSS